MKGLLLLLPLLQTHEAHPAHQKTRRLFPWEPEFTRLFFRLVVPIALQHLVGASLHIVDNVMVSRLG